MAYRPTTPPVTGLQGRPPRPPRLPAKVFARLRDDELVVIVCPDTGMGGGRWDVPIDLVPTASRVPNALLWIDLDDTWRITAVSERSE